MRTKTLQWVFLSNFTSCLIILGVGKCFLRLKNYPIKTAKFQYSALKVVPHESPVELWNHFLLVLQTQNVMNIRFLQYLLQQKNFPSKRIPVIRICLPHRHTEIICLRHIVACVFRKIEVLPAKTWKISRGIFLEFP